MDPISLLNWTPIVTIRRSVAVDQACLQLSGRSTLGQSAQNRFSIALIAVKAYGVLILRSIWIPRSMVLFHVSSATACTRSVRGVATLDGLSNTNRNASPGAAQLCPDNGRIQRRGAHRENSSKRPFADPAAPALGDCQRRFAGPDGRNRREPHGEARFHPLPAGK